MMRLGKHSLTALFALSLSLPCLAQTDSENVRQRISMEDEMTSSDVSAEVTFGREIAARILGRLKVYDDPALIKYVNLVGMSLLRNSSRPELEFHFTVLDSKEINAYAAPGGYVFVTVGAIRLMKDEAELAGVLAHEISHIAEMHVVKELKIKGTADDSISSVAHLVGGSSDAARVAFSQAVDQGVEMIFKDGYKRGDELQADRSAVMLCALNGYDASALARYLGRARTIKGEIPDTGESHPSFTTRIAQINDAIAKDGVDTSKSASNQKRFVATIAASKLSASR